MVTVIHQQNPIARRDYDCDACVFISDDIPDNLTFGELRIIARARQNGWKIKKGERYLRQFNTDGADTWTFRSIPGIAAICQKYDLYPD